MRRLAHWLVSLYPKAWKQRYGDEFHALLDDCSPDRLKVAGIVKGSLVMRIAELFQSPVRSAAVCAGLGAIVALAWVLTLPKQFRSEGVVSAPSTEHTFAAVQKALHSEQVAGFIRRNRLVFGDAREPVVSWDTIEEFRRNATFGTTAGLAGTSMRVAFSHPDPAKAQAVAREFQVAMIDLGQGLQAVSLANRPLSSERRAFGLPLLAGLSAGAILGLAASRILRRVRE